jgi:hypothetical protein
MARVKGQRTIGWKLWQVTWEEGERGHPKLLVGSEGDQREGGSQRTE